MRMTTAQRYACYCGRERVIPESPTTGPKRIRIGCDNCGKKRYHYAVGRV